MEKDTLTELSYGELIELFRAVRQELARRDAEVEIHITERPYGTDKT